MYLDKFFTEDNNKIDESNSRIMQNILPRTGSSEKSKGGGACYVERMVIRRVPMHPLKDKIKVSRPPRKPRDRWEDLEDNVSCRRTEKSPESNSLRVDRHRSLVKKRLDIGFFKASY